ncbi:hypothetical protein BGZ72_001695 [Mortierella alpina]|nr:hypothetical protein BGZ72_001695 [Mortierella alpina]
MDKDYVVQIPVIGSSSSTTSEAGIDLQGLQNTNAKFCQAQTNDDGGNPSEIAAKHFADSGFVHQSSNNENTDMQANPAQIKGYTFKLSQQKTPNSESSHNFYLLLLWLLPTVLVLEALILTDPLR